MPQMSSQKDFFLPLPLVTIWQAPLQNMHTNMKRLKVKIVVRKLEISHKFLKEAQIAVKEIPLVPNQNEMYYYCIFEITLFGS